METMRNTMKREVLNFLFAGEKANRFASP